MIYQTHQIVRDDLGANSPVVFAELGIYEAEYSPQLLTGFNVKKAYFIDSWEKTPTQGYAGHNQEEWDAIAARATARINAFPNTEVLRMTSLEALEVIPDESLDFIYIDASHYYEKVIEDLNYWTKKVRVGGWITGDDWPYEGVEKAAVEFLTANPQYKLIRSGSQFLFKKTTADYVNTLE